MRIHTIALLLAVCVPVWGCGDDSSSSEEPTGAPVAGTSRAAKSKPIPKKKAAGAHEGIRAADLVESDANRDPFRSYLSEILTPRGHEAKIQRKVLMQRYGLDELQLIAVVAGGTRPRAMFRDPTGLGVTVKRGDYIGKSAGKVKQILSDKVIVQIKEDLEDGQSVADRVIDLHPKDELGDAPR